MEKVARICRRIETLAEGDSTLWGRQLSEILRQENADAGTMAEVHAHLQSRPSARDAAAHEAWRHLLTPFLQARVSRDQVAAMNRLSRSIGYLCVVGTLLGLLVAWPQLSKLAQWIALHSPIR